MQLQKVKLGRIKHRSWSTDRAADRLAKNRLILITATLLLFQGFPFHMGTRGCEWMGGRGRTVPGRAGRRPREAAGVGGSPLLTHLGLPRLGKG